MEKLTLHEMQEIELGILKKFDSFCKENNIRYYLAHGTLLGAIRYKKFIPWDDDIDVLVPRDDYERLLRTFKDSEQYKLFFFEKDRKFHFPFAKLCDVTTQKVIPTYRNPDAIPGLELDIFPLDAWESNLQLAKKEVKTIRWLRLCLEAAQQTKCPVKTPMKRILWGFLTIFARMVGEQYFTARLIKISKKNELKGAPYVGNKAWNPYRNKDIIPAEVFTETIEVEFEGQMFSAPAGYDTYLTCLYGDYMPEPPVEKQLSNHLFKAYRR